MAFLIPWRALGLGRPWLAVAAGLFLAAAGGGAAESPTREYVIKAVFLFNFTQFVDWPPTAFASGSAPLVIGVLGDDPFDGTLDETVRGETSGRHPLEIRRCHSLDQLAGCHVLFISPSEAAHLDQIFGKLKGQSTLTVGESDEFAHRGGMVRFVTVENKIRLRINLAAAKSAGLVLSSKLLRPAEIVGSEKG